MSKEMKNTNGGGALECLSLASSSFDYAPFNKMKSDSKKIIMKDITFIRKSIDILDANDANFQWHKRCFQDHVQVHLQMIQDYHFPEMKPMGKSLNQNFIAPNQKVILSYMNGLRAVQNLLKSNAKSDELKALEMLKDWKAQALDEYDQYLVLQPVEEIKSSGRRRTVFFKGDEGAISKSSDLMFGMRAPSPQQPELKTSSGSGRNRLKMFTSSVVKSTFSPTKSKSVRQSLDSPGKFLSLLPTMK
eukprot:gene32805-42469_t